MKINKLLGTNMDRKRCNMEARSLSNEVCSFKLEHVRERNAAVSKTLYLFFKNFKIIKKGILSLKTKRHRLVCYSYNIAYNSSFLVTYISHRLGNFPSLFLLVVTIGAAAHRSSPMRSHYVSPNGAAFVNLKIRVTSTHETIRTGKI